MVGIGGRRERDLGDRRAAGQCREVGVYGRQLGWRRHARERDGTGVKIDCDGERGEVGRREGRSARSARRGPGDDPVHPVARQQRRTEAIEERETRGDAEVAGARAVFAYLPAFDEISRLDPSKTPPERFFFDYCEERGIPAIYLRPYISRT